MKKLNYILIIVFLNATFLGIFLPRLAFADALSEGVAAYQKDDCNTAFKIIEPLAQVGDAKAQHWLSALYAEGCGVSQDNQQAIKWLEKAAAQGDAESLENLGDLYRPGSEAKENIVEAYKYYMLADTFGQIEDEAELDDISRKMTPDQIAAGKSAAAKWLADHSSLERPIKRFSILLFLAMFVLPALFTAKFLKTQRPTLFYFRLFVGIAFFLFIGMPAYFMISKVLVSAVQPITFINTLGWASFAVATCVYAAERCSSKDMPYYDGMIYVSYCTSLWGMSASIMATLPVLLFVHAASVFISVTNDFLGQPERSPQQFHKLLNVIFRNRTQQ